jgi:hypothetical protein
MLSTPFSRPTVSLIHSINQALFFLSSNSNQTNYDAILSDLFDLIQALDHHNKPFTALSVFNWSRKNTPGNAYLFSNGGQPLVPFIISFLGRLGRLYDQ